VWLINIYGGQETVIIQQERNYLQELHLFQAHKERDLNIHERGASLV